MSNYYENYENNNAEEFDDDLQDELKYLEIKKMLEKADNAVAAAVAATIWL